jgi:protein-arginine kinase activator protein McsA
MAPEKAPKKVEEAVESSSPEGDVISNTTLHAIDSIKSWRKIFETLDYEIKNFCHNCDNKLRDIADSELLKVATCPRLMSYNDMISWAVERIDIQKRSILDSQGIVVGSFRPEHIQVMYKLSHNSKYIYNKEFVSEFQRKECTKED